MNKECNQSDARQKTKLMIHMLGNSNRLTQELNRRMKQDLSLTLAKYDVLTAISLSENGGITMSNLSRELSVSNANVTGMITRLLKDGFVLKKAFPSDRRIYGVTLTDEGKVMLEKATEKHEFWIKKLMASIDDDEVNLINKVLDKIDCQINILAANDEKL